MEVTNENPVTNSAEHLKPPRGRGYRHKMAYMIFTAFVISYCLRFNLSIALIGMVNNNYAEGHEHNDDFPCAMLYHNTSFEDAEEESREFDWNQETQGIIQGAFFVGYLLTNVPGGVIAEKIGGKWVMGVGIFLTSILALLIPIAARDGVASVCAVRVLQGMAQGVVSPAAHVLLAQWSPPAERSLLGATAFSGNQVGGLLAMLMSGLMISTNQLDAWPGTFYLSGGIGLMWCFIWGLFAYNKPWESPDISSAELQYIQSSLGEQITKEYVPIPWLKMMKSRAVWAIIIAQGGNGLGLFTLLTGLPSYMSKVLHFDIRQTAWLSGLPFLGMMIVSLISGHTATHLITKKLASTLTIRRVFNTIGHGFSSIAFLILAFAGCHQALAVTMIFIGISLSGASSVGFHVNHIDIAPQFAGILMGIGNLVGNLTVWATPYFISKMISVQDSLASWQIIFLVIAGILFLDNLLYIFMVSASEQSFNRATKQIR